MVLPEREGLYCSLQQCDPNKCMGSRESSDTTLSSVIGLQELTRLQKYNKMKRRRGIWLLAQLEKSLTQALSGTGYLTNLVNHAREQK